MSAMTFAIEGNIATGKSTFLHALAQTPEFQEHVGFYQEPVHMWQNINGTGHNILECFYKSPERYAYFFQNYVFLTRFMQYNDALSNPGDVENFFFERSVFTDKMVFARTAISNGFIQPIEAEVYRKWFNSVINVLPNLIPNVFVYLRAAPEVCSDRLKNRARAEEVAVSLEYLQQIHNCHERWFIEGSDVVNEQEGFCVRKISGERTHPLIDGKIVVVLECGDDKQKNVQSFVEFYKNFSHIYK